MSFIHQYMHWVYFQKTGISLLFDCFPSHWRYFFIGRLQLFFLFLYVQTKYNSKSLDCNYSFLIDMATNGRLLVNNLLRMIFQAFFKAQFHDGKPLHTLRNRSTSDSCWNNQNQIVFIIFRLIWNQTEIRLADCSLNVCVIFPKYICSLFYSEKTAQRHDFLYTPKRRIYQKRQHMFKLLWLQS